MPRSDRVPLVMGGSLGTGALPGATIGDPAAQGALV